jgi:hypothetical protein
MDSTQIIMTLKQQAEEKVKDATKSIAIYTHVVSDFATFKRQHPDLHIYDAPRIQDEERNNAIAAIDKAELACKVEKVDNELHYYMELKDIIKTCAGISRLFNSLTMVIREIYKISAKQHILQEHLRDPWCFTNWERPESHASVQLEMEENWDEEIN